MKRKPKPSHGKAFDRYLAERMKDPAFAEDFRKGKPQESIEAMIGRLTLTHTETLAAGEALAVALERHRDRAFDGDAAALAAWAKLTGAGK